MNVDERGKPQYDPKDPEYLEWAAKNLEHFGFLPIDTKSLARIVRKHVAALRIEWRLKGAERRLRNAERRLDAAEGSLMKARRELEELRGFWEKGEQWPPAPPPGQAAPRSS